MRWAAALRQAAAWPTGSASSATEKRSPRTTPSRSRSRRSRPACWGRVAVWQRAAARQLAHSPLLHPSFVQLNFASPVAWVCRRATAVVLLQVRRLEAERPPPAPERWRPASSCPSPCSGTDCQCSNFLTFGATAALARPLAGQPPPLCTGRPDGKSANRQIGKSYAAAAPVDCGARPRSQRRLGTPRERASNHASTRRSAGSQLRSSVGWRKIGQRRGRARARSARRPRRTATTRSTGARPRHSSPTRSPAAAPGR